MGALRVALARNGRPLLCAICSEDDAYVVASTAEQQYGHCSRCDHTVFLGRHDAHWILGDELADVLAKEVLE